MNQKVLNYLNNYSYDTKDVNRLLVSVFLKKNNIAEVKNEFIKSYIISEGKELSDLERFVSLFKDNSINIEVLIELFEFVISPQDKEVNGAVYTPEYIRKYIVLNSITQKENKDISSLKFGDIACGCGGFFKTIVEVLKNKTNKSYFDIYKDNIYGLDIQEYSVVRTKILLCLIAIINNEDAKKFEFNLYCGNALNFEWEVNKEISSNRGFDIIVGNPPYVGTTKIDNETKALLKNWSVSSTGKSDLYIPFFQIGLENLNDTGILGFITVNTFIKSLNGRAVRKYFSEHQFDLSIVDFGGEQLFRNRSTYTCICTIGKKPHTNLKYLKTTSNNISKKDFIKIPYSKLNDFEGWYLNLEKVNDIILKIEKTGEPLGQKFEIRNGFATLKNSIYIFKPTKESDDFFFFEQEGKEIKIEKGICKNTIKPNTLKSESELGIQTEKLIFPYEFIEENNLFYKQKKLVKIFEEPYLKSQFPFAYKYLKSKKTILAKRDKGIKKYEKWYAYGRNQALTVYGYKLLFPYISSSPCFVYTDDKDLLFYNGYAIISDSSEDLLTLQKILMSKVFWFYIKYTSKPYSGEYFSLAKNYVKNFGICHLSEEEKLSLREANCSEEINDFLLKKYDIKEEEIN